MAEYLHSGVRRSHPAPAEAVAEAEEEEPPPWLGNLSPSQQAMIGWGESG